MNNRRMAQRSQKQEIYTTRKKAWSHFALLLILSLKARLSTASDTMYRGQSLAWGQTLTSKSGIFELGFFTPGTSSHEYYVGIWDLNLYIWSINLRQWNLLWTEASRHCEIDGFCGNYGICTRHKVPPCDCLKGFEPRWPGNWSIQDYSGGCIRRTPLGCSIGGIDKFLTMHDMLFGKLFGVATKINGTVQDIESCKLTCLRDCDCIAYAISYGECFNMKQLMSIQIPSDTETGEDLYVRISASEQFELVGSRTKMSKKAAWILGVLAMLILLLSIVLAIKLWKPSADGALEESEFSLMLFKYRDLRKATKNFSQKLGEGGFARVAMAINKGEDLLPLLDFKLEGNANVEELTRACKVACWCIQDGPRDRPTMGTVVKILEGLMQLGIPQIPLYFRRLSESSMEASVCHEIETCSSSY
ncbi:hypothetical protein CMV_021368 [Castanea mollissima]|uniref:Apple domain-containing protein n=1 Tax=Castanea mollissima TaxID=60419 RepID=A0A8J4QJZ2_9ROSI|nr:hypothetical protein CMV_021368 [Castanea mollissima]